MFQIDTQLTLTQALKNILLGSGFPEAIFAILRRCYYEEAKDFTKSSRRGGRAGAAV